MFGNPRRVEHFDAFPDGGGYPLRFVDWALKIMGCGDPSKVLHLCSGSMQTGITVDIRPELTPDIVADCRAVPLPDGSQMWILADPPYSEEYAENLYGTGADYPRPGQIMREAARLLKPGGLVGLLHFQVPMIPPELVIEQVFGVTTGCGFNIRAWTLCRKAAKASTLPQSNLDDWRNQ
jgi:hypothetical protein